MTSAINTLILVFVALMLALSQILLKAAVVLVRTDGKTAVLGMLTSLLTIWQFWLAIIVSGCVMLLWAWVLTFVPLSKAYPFVVLAFVFAAIFDSIFFGQSLSLKFFLGCALILAGLIVIVR